MSSILHSRAHVSSVLILRLLLYPALLSQSLSSPFRSHPGFTMLKPKLPSIQLILHSISNLSIEPFRLIKPNFTFLASVEFLNELFKESVRGLCGCFVVDEAQRAEFGVAPFH